MDADDVRQLVLRDHERIREDLGYVRKALLAGDRLALSFSVPALIQHLRQHLDLEDTVLEPVLRRIDAWGEVRAQRLRADHVFQRAELRALEGRIDGEMSRFAEMSQRVRKFVDALERDMEQEERDVLSAELLTDNPVCGDGFAG
jgi:hypothetical protein